MSKSSYFKWKKRIPETIRKEQENNKIIEAIKELYMKNKGRYGVGPMTERLRQEKEIHCNHKKVYKLMKEYGYLSVVKRKKKYKKAGKPHPKHNVLRRNFTTSCPYDKMATDVTEISMFGKKLYISPVKDLHTQMIESVEIGKSATLVTVMKMLEKIKDKSIHTSLIRMKYCSFWYTFIFYFF